MSPTNSFNDEDPLALAIRPPADETPQQRDARLAAEAAAKKISDVFAHRLLAHAVRAGIAVGIHTRNRHHVLEEFDDIGRLCHRESLIERMRGCHPGFSFEK